MADDLKEVWRAELARGIALLVRGDDSGAEHLRRAHAQAPARPETCLALGRERLRVGEVDEGELLLRRAWGGEPKMTAAAAALARCVGVRQGNFEEAHAILDEALHLLGDDAGLRVVRAELLLEEVRADEARVELEQALEIVDAEARPATRLAIAAGLARVYNLDGIRLGNQGDAEGALFAFKRAAGLAPDWAGPLVNMGAAFARLGKAMRARQCYEKALRVEPENPVARYNLGHLARERGDLAAAETAYRRLLATVPDYPGARVSLAEVLLVGERFRDVLALWEGRRKVGPSDFLQLGMAWDGLAEVAQAEAASRGGLALDPDNLPCLCRLAVLLARDGRYPEAAELLRRARAQDPERADLWINR